MAQPVVIEFEGIMILSFLGEQKCTVGVPPTDNRHEFQLEIDGTVQPIGMRSRIYLADQAGQPIVTKVKKQPAFFLIAIDFKSSDFHLRNFKFIQGYKHSKRLEIFNGDFEVFRVTGAEFKRGGGPADLTRSVAESVKLRISLNEGEKVIFEDDTSKITLTPSQIIRITNICDENVSGVPDFQYYYNALDIASDQQRIPVIPVQNLFFGTKVTSKKDAAGSPNLPCWIGGYDEPPSQPDAG